MRRPSMRAVNGPFAVRYHFVNGSRRPATSVGKNLDLLECDQSVSDHLVELRQDGADAILLVDHLDQDRQVLGQAQETRRVKVCVRAEAFDAAQDRRAGHASFAEEGDDDLIEGFAIAMVRFTDVDADEEGGAVDAHQMARPIASPVATAKSPTTTDPPRLAIAAPYDPLSMSPHDSSMYVENVVYAPMKPIMTGPRISAGRIARSVVAANNSPS